jgi:hypothetical protein
MLVAACEAPNPVETEREAIEIAQASLKDTPYANGPFVAKREKRDWRVSVPGPIHPGSAYVTISSRTGKAEAYIVELTVERAPPR